MKYQFSNNKEVTYYNKICLEIFREVQLELREYFTFDIRLIGSGGKRLVTQRGTEPFDLDYNFILQRDKKNLIGNPKQIKDMLIARFNRALENRGFDFKYPSNSTSVITAKFKERGNIIFSFDIAIIAEFNDGFSHRIMFDKPTNRYFWNRVQSSKDYAEKFQIVKDNDCFLEFKNRYLKLKDKYMDSDKKSFEIFLETLNAFSRLWS